ncbi:MAG: flippase [Cytophagaceae bacterium]
MASKFSYWLKSGVYTLLERFSALLFGFGSFFFLVRVLSKEDFGVWALFLTVTAFIEVARNGLIQNAQVKFLTSAPKEEHAKITTASMVLNFGLTGLSIFLILIFSSILSLMWKSPVLEQMFYIYIITTVSLIPFSQCNFIQQANLDFKGIFWSNFVRQGLLFFYVLYAFVFNFSLALTTLAIVQAITSLAGAIVAYLFAKKFMVWAKAIDWQWVSKLFHFGKYVFGTNVSSLFFKGMDQMMLGSMIGTASVAMYNAAIRISNLVEVPTTSVATVVFPQSAKRMATEGLGAVKHLYEKSVGLIMAIMLPFLLVILVFPETIIWILAGEQYLDSAPILQVTILYSLFIPFLRQFGTVLDSIGKPHINFYFIVFCAVLNFGSNYFFITHYGIIGAAYGSLTSYAIIFILNQIILYKKLRINTLVVFVHMKDFYVIGFNTAYSFYQTRFKKSSKSDKRI